MRRSLEAGSFLGRYQIVGPLGQGGMGVVYRARDAELGRDVAVKLVTTSGASTDTLATRLMREAQALAQLSHPNVVAVYDVGRVEDGVFLAMELVPGETGEQWIKRRPPWREVLQVFRDAGRGLAAAHKVGLVHRDFKPANLILGSDGRVRVLDFGLARIAQTGGSDSAELEGLADDASTWSGESSESAPTRDARLPATATGSTEVTRDEPPAPPEAVKDPMTSSERRLLETPLTQVGAIVGTPPYMAPEQHLGGGCDARTDQFSFCVAFYQALYGERPFDGANYAELSTNIIKGKLRPPPANAAVPAWLRAVVLRGLSVLPERRFASMDADPRGHGQRSGAAPATHRRRRRGGAAGRRRRRGVVAQRARTSCVPRRRAPAGRRVGRRAPRPSARRLRQDGQAVCARRVRRGGARARRLQRQLGRDAHRRVRGDARARHAIGRAARLAHGVLAATARRRARRGRRLCRRRRRGGHARGGDVAFAPRARAVRRRRGAAGAGAAARRRGDEAARGQRAQVVGHGTRALAGRPLRRGAKADDARSSPRRARSAIARSRARRCCRRRTSPIRPAITRTRKRAYADAAVAAEAGRDDQTAALAECGLVWVMGERLGKYAEAHEHARAAQAKIERLGRQDLLQAQLDAMVATLLLEEGKYKEAEERSQRVLAIREKVLGPDDVAIADALGDLGRRQGGARRLR